MRVKSIDRIAPDGRLSVAPDLTRRVDFLFSLFTIMKTRSKESLPKKQSSVRKENQSDFKSKRFKIGTRPQIAYPGGRIGRDGLTLQGALGLGDNDVRYNRISVSALYFSFSIL